MTDDTVDILVLDKACGLKSSAEDQRPRCPGPQVQREGGNKGEVKKRNDEGRIEERKQEEI